MIRHRFILQPQAGALNARIPCRTTPKRANSVHYTQALQLARGQHYDNAREAFQNATSAAPEECKVWVAWAQMEKRAEKIAEAEVISATSSTYPRGQRLKFMRCRSVLQRGLQLNPGSACLLQAWGLLELQAGNTFAALALLEQSVRADPACSPVLRWQNVQAARLARSTRHKQCQPVAQTHSMAAANGC